MEEEIQIGGYETWLPLAKAGALGWLPITNSSFSPAPERQSLHNKKIVMNVSGRKFETFESTLQRFPDTLLGSYQIEQYYDPFKKEYFFDTDPLFFRHILNYYRRGKLHFSYEECGTSFEDELKFFRIPIQAIDPCCSEEVSEMIIEEPEKKEDEDDEDDQLPHVPTTPREKLWFMFENPIESHVGKIVYYVTAIAIVVSVITTVVETVPCGAMQCGQAHATVFKYIEGTCVIIFTIEYVGRFFSAPNRRKFVFEPASIIDLIAILPFYIDLLLEDSSAVQGLVVLRVFRVFRVFKFSRHSSRLQNLGNSLKSSASELGFILFSFHMGVIIFATVVFYAERNVSGTLFNSIPDAAWYALVTMTTLGYGDMTPETMLGKLAGSICCIVGTLVIALPVPIIEMKMKMANKVKPNRTPSEEETPNEDEGPPAGES